MRLNSKPIYLIMLMLVSLAAAFLIHLHAQLRLRLLRDEIQGRAQLITRMRDEHERLSRLSRNQYGLQFYNPRLREVLKLRGEIGVLRRTFQELNLENGSQVLSRSEVLMCKNQLLWDRVNRLKQEFQEMSAEPIPEFQYMSVRDWVDLLWYQPEIERRNMRALSWLRSAAQIHFAMRTLREALRSYAADNSGSFPFAISDLERYFNSPVDPSALENWVIMPTSSLPDSIRIDEELVITQKAATEPELEQRIVLGLDQARLGTSGGGDWKMSP
jgi:hypothetical protein